MLLMPFTFGAFYAQVAAVLSRSLLLLKAFLDDLKTRQQFSASPLCIEATTTHRSVHTGSLHKCLSPEQDTSLNL